MDIRDIKSEDFVGKTISSIDNSYSDVIVFYFTDGSMVELWAETANQEMAYLQIEINPTAVMENEND